MLPCFPRRPQPFFVLSTAGLTLMLAASCLPACSSNPDEPSGPGGSSNVAAGTAGAVAGMKSEGGVANGGAQASGGSGAGGLSSSAGVGGTTSPPMGGSAGSVATAGSGGGGTATLIVSDDFEAATDTPDTAKWSVFNGSAMGANANTVGLSTEQAHSGTHSVKIDVKNAGAMLMTKVGLPPASGVLYYRAWVRFVNGAASTATWQPHVTFIEAGGLLDNGDVDQGDEARLGGQAGKIAANLSQGDGLSPNPFTMPCALCADPPASDKWVCVEGLFDVTNKKTAAWLDGVQVVKAESTSDWHAASTYPAALERIGFGWETYGSVANTVYYDDIAVSSERINCN